MAARLRSGPALAGARIPGRAGTRGRRGTREDRGAGTGRGAARAPVGRWPLGWRGLESRLELDPARAHAAARTGAASTRRCGAARIRPGVRAGDLAGLRARRSGATPLLR